MTRPNFVDYTGQQFGDWTVLGPTGEYVNEESNQPSIEYWHCKCKCGQMKFISLHTLKGRGSSKCRNCASATANLKHGVSAHYLYNICKNVLSRCYSKYNKKYSAYGDRGIEVFPAWHDIVSFIKGVENILGPRPSIKHHLSRIDNDKGYEPGNIKWELPRVNSTEIWREEYKKEIYTIFLRAMQKHRLIPKERVFDNFKGIDEVSISNYGDIIGRTLSTRSNYFVICIHYKMYYVHRLVYALFTNAHESFGDISHLNDVRTDNRIWNLIEGSKKENMRMKAYNYKRRTENLPHLWWLPESQRKELMPMEL